MGDVERSDLAGGKSLRLIEQIISSRQPLPATVFETPSV
jgi:hypothetical protein